MKRLILLTLPALLAACNRAGADIPGVKTYKTTGANHQEGRLSYPQTPPVGGPHNPTWQNCGVYDQPLYKEYAVHSMEHGAVWLTYKQDLPADQVEQLKQAVAGRSYTILSPHETQTAPLILTGWNAQLEVQDVSDPRVKQFLQKYEQGGEAPEIGASCSGAYSGTA
jgi:hypothetical protein